MYCEKLKILGHETPDLGILFKLSLIDHYNLFPTLCDDQLVNLVQIEQVVFQNFGFLL